MQTNKSSISQAGWMRMISKGLGFNKTNPQTKTLSYSRMMKNRIAKRRACNKVARKSRRINQLRT